MRRGECGTVAQERGRAVRLRHPGVPSVLGTGITVSGVPMSLGTKAFPPRTLLFLVVLLQRHGVVQVQHEERRGGRLLPGREGPGTVRQAQDGEDLSLDLPALVIAQAPVNKTGVHMVVTQPATGAGQKPQAAPRQSENSALQRCHLDGWFGLPCEAGLHLDYRHCLPLQNH